MTQITIEDAARRLSALIHEADDSEILLTENGRPVAKLVPLQVAPRVPGSAADLPHFMAEDFDDIPDGFEEYTP